MLIFDHPGRQPSLGGSCTKREAGPLILPVRSIAIFTCQKNSFSICSPLELMENKIFTIGIFGICAYVQRYISLSAVI